MAVSIVQLRKWYSWRSIVRCGIGAFLLGTVVCSFPGSAISQPGVIIVDDDPGGIVADHLRWYHRVKDSGVPVILRGMCVSACTFVLTLPHDQVCVEPTASLGFHMAKDMSNDQSLPDYTKALIIRYYPPAVQKWLSDKKLVDEPIFMMAQTIVNLGVFPACPA